MGEWYKEGYDYSELEDEYLFRDYGDVPRRKKPSPYLGILKRLKRSKKMSKRQLSVTECAARNKELKAEVARLKAENEKLQKQSDEGLEAMQICRVLNMKLNICRQRREELKAELAKRSEK